MRYEITEAIPHPDHTVTVTWSGGGRFTVSLASYLERGELFEALKDPDYFVREMRLLPGGIGLTWPNEVDFSADDLRYEAMSQIAIRAFAGAKDEAIAENDRLGIPSYGTDDDGKITVRYPPKRDKADE